MIFTPQRQRDNGVKQEVGRFMRDVPEARGKRRGRPGARSGVRIVAVVIANTPRKAVWDDIPRATYHVMLYFIRDIELYVLFVLYENGMVLYSRCLPRSSVVDDDNTPGPVPP